MPHSRRNPRSFFLITIAALWTLAAPAPAQDRPQLPLIQYDGQIDALRPMFEDLNNLREIHNAGGQPLLEDLCDLFPRLSGAEFLLAVPTGEIICTRRFFVFTSCEEERRREPEGSLALLGAQAQLGLIVEAHPDGGVFSRLLRNCAELQE